MITFVHGLRRNSCVCIKTNLFANENAFAPLIDIHLQADAQNIRFKIAFEIRCERKIRKVHFHLALILLFFYDCLN